MSYFHLSDIILEVADSQKLTVSMVNISYNNLLDSYIPGLGVGKLCQHNFEHNRCVQAFENYIMLAL